MVGNPRLMWREENVVDRDRQTQDCGWGLFRSMQVIFYGVRYCCRCAWQGRKSYSMIFDILRWRGMLMHDFSQLQYPSLPWVRYITQSGDIAVRLPDVQ